MEAKISWEKTTLEKFNQLIERIPIFMRDIARDKVSNKAEALIRKDGRAQVEEKDMVDAFFAETPFGFHGPMKNDLKDVGIDYMKYGYDK
jgi:hypothetical protein